MDRVSKPMTKESRRKLDVRAAHGLARIFFNYNYINFILLFNVINCILYYLMLLLEQVVFCILDHLQRWLKERRSLQDSRYEAIKSA